MTENLPKITVITATFNLIKAGRETFFRQCVESVHNQTYPNIEHIIMDGASTDGSLDLIREYEAKGWLKCYSEPDAGIDDGYNHGLAHANGKYVFFMNSDDKYFSDDALAECVKKMEEENADYCYGIEQRYDRNGTFLSTWKPQPEIFWLTMPFSHQTMGCCLDILKKLNNCDTDYGFGGDFCLIQKLILNDFKGVYVDKIISYYRTGGISSSADSIYKNMQTVFVIARRIFNFSKEFYAEITYDDCVHMVLNPPQPGFKDTFPKFYLQRLVKYLIDKKLKNINYDKVISLIFSYKGWEIGQTNKVSNIENSNVTNQTKKTFYIRLFNLIPIIEIRRNRNYIRIRLFNLIPIIKIKRC